MTNTLLLHSTPRIRLALSLLAALAVALIVLAALHAGVADARPGQWYPCWIEDYGWMYCMDIEN